MTNSRHVVIHAGFSAKKESPVAHHYGKKCRLPAISESDIFPLLRDFWELKDGVAKVKNALFYNAFLDFLKFFESNLS